MNATEEKMEVEEQTEQPIERPEWSKVWVPKLEEIKLKVEKVNAKCLKLGLPLMTLVENKRWVEDIYLGMVSNDNGFDYNERRDHCLAPIIQKAYVDVNTPGSQWDGKPAYYAAVEWAEVKVAGEAPKLAGWSLIARVEAFPNGNLLHVVPDQTVPMEFRTRDAKECDHCHLPRSRKDTFVLRHEDGRYVLVGRNCIKDFLGHNNPDDILWLFNQYMNVLAGGGEGGEPWEGFGGGRITVYDAIELLAVTAAKVEQTGFISKKTAEEQSKLATSDAVYAHYNDQRNPATGYDPRIHWEDRHLEVAKAVIAWVKSTTEDSDYMQNIRLILSQERVNNKHLGYACSAVSAYNKAMDIQDKRQRHGAEWAEKIAKSAHVGEVGKRQDFELLLTGHQAFESQYGTKVLMKFEDRAGNIVVWWNSGSVDAFCTRHEETYGDGRKHVSYDGRIRTGVWFKIKATVKEHGDYKGLKQTTLSRATVLGEVGVPELYKEGDRISFKYAGPDDSAYAAKPVVGKITEIEGECVMVKIPRRKEEVSILLSEILGKV